MTAGGWSQAAITAQAAITEQAAITGQAASREQTASQPQALRRLAEALWLASLVIVPIMMNVAGARSFEAFKLLAFAPLAALLLAVALAAGGHRHRTDRAFQGVPALAFAALIAIATLATALSDAPLTALTGGYFRREGLLAWFTCGALFAALITWLDERAQMHRIADALVLASVVPCVYALQQRFGFDAFDTSGLAAGAGARPGGTLGNPIFLASWLLLVAPLCLARLATLLPGPSGWRLRAALVALVGLQLIAAVVSQSRGPLLGLALAIVLFIALSGALRKRGRLFAGTLCAGLVLALALAVLMANPDLARHEALSGSAPLLARFALGGGADPGSSSRLAIWQAGADAFLHAPGWRQWIGYGPDVAHFAYFPYLSPEVVRVEGYATTIDRLHNGILETSMTLGLAGLAAELAILCGAVWLGARHMFAMPTPWALARLAGASITGVTMGALAAAGAGGRALIPVGAGVGLGLGLAVFLLLAAWRGGTRPAQPIGDRIWMAGLASALIGAWIAAQVGVASISSRLTETTLLAMIMVLSRRAGVDAGTATAPDRSWPSAMPWLTGVAIVAACGSLFPPVFGQLQVRAPAFAELDHLGRVAIPLLTLLATGILLSTAAPVARGAWLKWCAIPIMLFMAMLEFLGSAIDRADNASLGAAVASLAQWTCAMLIVLPVVAALAAPRSTALPATRRAVAWLTGGALLALMAGGAGMLALRGEAWARLAVWGRAHQPATAPAFDRRALETMPAEPHYAAAYAARLIEAGTRDIAQVAVRPQAGRSAVLSLRQAESLLAQVQQRLPGDPWTALARANALQLLAQRSLESFVDPGERRRLADAARVQFARAQRQYPAHPWIMRNWAQLEFEQGERAAGHARLDAMERIDPRTAAAYTERARATRIFGDHALGLAALARGIAALPATAAETAVLRQDLSSYLVQLGRVPEAIQVLEQWRAADPQSMAAVARLAEAYAADGRQSQALELATRATAQMASGAAGDEDLRRLDALAQRLRRP